ncbi:MAG: thiolase family protein [Deltaproteobacteria bacterium]|nr:thiolase family protein [Deltaproteobacteria bacterium]
MRTAYIVSGARTAVGRAIKGTLKDVRPEDLAGVAVKEAVARSGVPQAEIDDLILGCAMPEGTQGMNIARVVSFMAGLPVESSAMTINRFCSSGLQAIALAAQNVMCGFSDAIVAGGVESMSTVPMGGYNLLPHPGLMETNPEVYTPMGVTAENVVAKYGLTREEMDQFACNSHMKAVTAQKEGKFEGEIVPVPYRNWATGETCSFAKDECPRGDTTLEGLAKLKGVFKQGGSVTAGNSSPTNDGAAAVVVVSEEALKRHNLKPLVRFVNFQVAGVPPEIMGIGPAAAVPKLIRKTGLKYDDVGLWELNEAFAAQSVAVVKLVPEINTANLNVNGGAIALGHPLGCTGAKLTVQIMNEMQRRKAKYGVVGMCIGGGMGAAGLFELA